MRPEVGRAFVVDVVAHAADDVGADVHAVAENRFLDVLHHLAHLHDVHEERFEADQVGEHADVEEVRRDALDLVGDHAQVFGARWYDEAGDLLDGHGVSLRMAVRAQRADALGEYDVLENVAFGREILDAAMDVAGVDVDVGNGLARNVDAKIHRFFERDVQRSDRNGEVAHAWLPVCAMIFSHSPLVVALLASAEKGISRSRTAPSIDGSMNRRRGSGWPLTTTE